MKMKRKPAKRNVKIDEEEKKNYFENIFMPFTTAHFFKANY
jgi:hypothetical protein